MNVVKSLSRALLLLIAIAAVMVLLDMASLRAFNTAQRINVGDWGDQEVLRGFFHVEQDSKGTLYRWTTGDDGLYIHSPTLDTPLQLELETGGIPPSVPSPLPVQMVFNNGYTLEVPVPRAERRALIMLPAGALDPHRTVIKLQSSVTSTPPDPRQLGVRLDSVTVRWMQDRQGLVHWSLLLIQTLIVGVCIVTCQLIGVHRGAITAAAGAIMVLLALISGKFALFASVWQLRFLVILVILLLLFRVINAPIRRYLSDLEPAQVSVLLFFAFLCFLPPLLGVLYPPFGDHDQGIHLNRLRSVMQGQTLLVDRPFEFHGRESLTPSTYYLLLLPWTLLTTSYPVIIHSFYALVLGSTGLVLALFVRSIGGSFRAALLSLLMVAGLPVQFTILWWGFGPQMVGQWVTVLLAVLAALHPPRTRSFWLGAFLVFCLLAMLHNGSAALGCGSLGLYVLIGLVRDRAHLRYWLHWAGIMAAGVLIAVLLIYINVVFLDLEQTRAAPIQPLSVRWPYLVQGLGTAFRPFGLIFGALGLAALGVWTRGRQRWLVLSWLGVAAFFLCVDVLFAMQVRYGYFLAPMVCAGLALLLSRGAERFRWAAAAVWAVPAFVHLQGIMLWYNAAIEGIKPTITGLTHFTH